MELVWGRPEDCTGRLEKEVRAYDLLDSLNIEYQRIDHEPAMTMEACAHIDAALDAVICKNLLLCNRQCTAFYLLMIPGDKVFKTSALSKQIGSSRLSFAPPEEMERYLGVTPGSATVLALMNDREHRVTLVLDRSVAEAETFGCHPCINTSTLSLSMVDIREKFLPHLGVEPRIVDLPEDQQG